MAQSKKINTIERKIWKQRKKLSELVPGFESEEEKLEKTLFTPPTGNQLQDLIKKISQDDYVWD